MGLRFLGEVLLVAALVATTSCSGEQSETGAGTGGTATGGAGAGGYGTCDRKDLVGGCIESAGPSPAIQDQRDGCLDAGGTWTTDACPTNDLVGCCEYTFGLDFRECWYIGTSSSDPAALCASMDGTYTPAG